MGDWNKPSLTDGYANFETELTDRDFDAASMGFGTVTNAPTGMFRYVRASNKFQEYDGSAWNDKVISVAGGGTGSSTASAARTALGIGTLGAQDANNVTITGGTIAGLGSLGVNGDATIGGLLKVGSTPITLTNAAGKILGLTSTILASLDGSALTGFTASQIPSLDAAKVTTGVFGTARLGTGTASSSKFLRGDGSWQVVSVAPVTQHKEINLGAGESVQHVSISTVADVTKAFIVPRSNMQAAYSSGYGGTVKLFFSDASSVEVTTGSASYVSAQVTSDTSGLAGANYAFDVVEWP